jgi:Bacterial TSP3 repeat
MPLFDPPKNLPLNTPPQDMFAPSSPPPRPPAPPPPPAPPLPPRPTMPVAFPVTNNQQPKTNNPIVPPLARPPVPPPPRVGVAPHEPEDIFSKTAPLGRDGGRIPKSPNPTATIAESPALGLGRKLTRLVFFAIGVIIIVGGGYALYIYVIAPSHGNKAPVNTNNNVSVINQNANVPANENANINANENANANVPANENANINANENANTNVNANAPIESPPAVVDTDGDGLSNADEINIYHTDPSKADTDGDGLSDRDEIVTWKTNPLNPDTDGDGYTDGSEVKNGYNPLGPGKLLPPVTPQ